jgi:hypothetical protein
MSAILRRDARNSRVYGYIFAPTGTGRRMRKSQGAPEGCEESRDNDGEGAQGAGRDLVMLLRLPFSLKREALIKQLVNKAIAGDPRSIKLILAELREIDDRLGTDDGGIPLEALRELMNRRCC